MKLFLANSWIDSRPILSQERIKASNLYTAIAKAARETKAKHFRPGGRKQKLSIHIEFVSEIKSTSDYLGLPADERTPEEVL